MPFIDPHRHERHHSIKLLAYAVIVVMDESNMKHIWETNEGVVMHFKTITTNLSKVLHLLVESIIYLSKQKASMQASIYTRNFPEQ